MSQRDQVYCHEWRNVWNRDEYGLYCPECNSEFTEIIDPSHDPRYTRVPDDTHADDTSSRPGSERSRTFYVSQHPQRGDNTMPPPVMGQFANMLRSLSVPVTAHHHHVIHATSDRQPQGSSTRHTAPHFVYSTSLRQFSQPINRETYAESGSDRQNMINQAVNEELHESMQHHPDDTQQPTLDSESEFQSFVNFFDRSANQSNQFVNQFMNQSPFRPYTVREGNAETQPQAFQQLSDIFTQLLNPTFVVPPNVVFTQETLDDVISRLMEQNTMSNAPGPASAEAIAALETKAVDDEILGADGRAECSICMEDVVKGERVTVLRCGHWFHGPCVISWLNEHDTCPHCREGISNRDAERSEESERPEALSRSDVSERSGRSGRSDVSERSEREESVRSDRSTRPEWSDVTDRPDRPDRPDRLGRSGRSGRSSRSDMMDRLRLDRIPRMGRMARMERQDRPERTDRGRQHTNEGGGTTNDGSRRHFYRR